MKKSSLIASAVLGLLLVLTLLVALAISGAFGSDSTRLVFASSGAEKQYDGTALKASGWSLIDGELKEGHTVQAEVTGSQTETGVSKNLMTVKIFDENGNDVTNEYNIEYQYGNLRVDPITIVLMSESVSKEYDAEPLVCDEAKIVSGYLLAGHRVETTSIGSRTEIGTSPNTFDYKILGVGGEDVSQNYTVTKILGTLDVTPISIILSTSSAAKNYDGEELTSSAWFNLTRDKLLEGHTISEVVLNGRITSPGTAPNTIESVTVVDEDGNDVTSYYDFSQSEIGILTVRPGAGIISVKDVPTKKGNKDE